MMRKFILACCLICLSTRAAAAAALRGNPSSPIPVDGWGDWSYVYDPSFLPLPPEATVDHAHGIAIQDDGTLVITYVDKVDTSRCLLRWNASGYQEIPEFLGPGTSLCQGVPHGLRAAFDEDSGETVLYHANNEQSLHKTTINGDIIWSNNEKPAGNNYRPTWFASQPGSPFVYLADGYGSSKIFVYNKTSGAHTGRSFGGRGNSSQHGNFQTSHAIEWDRRSQQMVVCDRENHRLEYFRVNQTDDTVFEYTHTVSFFPLLKRPCNIRVRPGDGAAIIPFLEGPVGIVNYDNELVSVVNISATLGDQGFLHPHDAHFVPGTSGDFVLVTWNPGRIGYFRRTTKAEYTATPQDS